MVQYNPIRLSGHEVEYVNDIGKEGGCWATRFSWTKGLTWTRVGY
jgi:hypothetical protein